MKPQRLVSSNTLARMFREAAAAWQRLDYAEALEVLERAARLDPANTNIQLDLGRAYGMRYNYGEAERCLEKAVRIGARKAEVLAEAARRCQEFGNDKLAKQFFDRAALEKDASAGVFVALAEIMERQARLETATDLTERALGLEPKHVPARLVRARLDRLSGRLLEAEQRVRDVLAEPAGEPWVRARSWYELGEILDRQGRYKEAFAALLEAKTLVRPLAEKHKATLTGIQARVSEMAAGITPVLLERWAAACETMRPLRRLAVLCGHPRSGTTLLEQVLDAHPEVVAAEETQILHDEAYLPLCRGFGAEVSVLDVLSAASDGLLRQAREDYFRFTSMYLGRAIEGKMLLDKNPALNVLIPAVARIFPEAKFLVALRDPRDVCLSCFMQPLTPNPVSTAYLTLEGTVTQYLSVMGLWRTLRSQLKNPFLEVRYEQLVDDLAGTARRTLVFLELDWNTEVLRFDEHARGKTVRSPSYAEVARPVTKRAIGRWRNYREQLEPHLARLEPMMAALGYA